MLFPHAPWQSCFWIVQRFLFLVVGLLVVINFRGSLFAASPAVEIEVVHEGVRSPVAPQEWAEILGRAGFSRVSIRSRKSSDVPGIEDIGTLRLPRYRVIAFLRNDKLVLPPADRFGKRDLRQIKSWIKRLQNDGIDTPENPKGPFGLSSQQLNLLRKQMAATVQQETAEQPMDRVMEEMLRTLTPTIQMSSQARRKLQNHSIVKNEFQGIAIGTSLAALLRPHGWGLKPEMSAGQAVWRFVEKRPGEAVWPVGWESDQSAARTLPILVKQVETQKVTIALDSAIRQLAQRMNVRLLLDMRELDAEGIDTSAKVSMRSGRFLYSAVLRHLLHQVRLSFAVRLDDSAQPFLWVSTYQSLKSP